MLYNALQEVVFVDAYQDCLNNHVVVGTADARQETCWFNMSSLEKFHEGSSRLTLIDSTVGVLQEVEWAVCVPRDSVADLHASP